MLWKLNKLKDIPVFVQQELSKQADGGDKAQQRKEEKERSERLGRGLSSQTETATQTFEFKMDPFIAGIAKEDYERKYTGPMQKSVKRMELSHHQRLMYKRGHRPLFDTPDYLQAFVAPPKLGDLQNIARAVLDDTFDEKAED